MTFNQDTYASDLLFWLGGENVFAKRDRRYPMEADLGNAQPDEPAGRDTRYPRISIGEIQAANPEVILLPGEPYAFTEEHRQELMKLFPEVQAVRNGKIYLVDGSLVTWHGTRLAKAISQLRPLFD
jgi:ABC-type Fe3+-hydroxamate transport system substrate-binding protein